MKKFIHLVLLFAMVMSFSVNSVALAQEGTDTPVPTTAPTAEPTTAPAAEPTAEPTTAPTAEPTAEPTTAPTTAPTGEPTTAPTGEPTTAPTGEPTTAPTVEPTTAPTAEPTTAPTGEPTTAPTGEPTAEPTESPTVTATVEITPTATITATPVITTELVGDIEAAALPGTYNTQYLGAVNISSSSATASLALYPQDSGAATNVSLGNIAAGGSVFAALDTVPSGKAYAGVINSSQALAAGAININATAKAGDSYLGSNTPLSAAILPIIFRNHVGICSKFHIQNPEGSSQVVTVKTYPIGQSSPLPSTPPTYSVPANTSISVDFCNDANFNAFGSGTNKLGYARIEAESGKKIVVIGEAEKGVAGAYFNFYHSGFDPSATTQDLVIPIAFAGHSGFRSGIGIVNLGGDTQVTLTYKANNGQTYTLNQQLAANALGGWTMTAAGLPNPSYGSVALHSSSSNIVAYNTTDKKDTAFSIGALNPGAATQKIAFPIAFNTGTFTDWLSGVGVYAIGGNAQVTSTWVRANADPNVAGNKFTFSTTVNQNTLGGWSSSQTSGLPTNFVGSVIVESTNGVGILGYINNTRQASGYGAQMPGFQY